MSAEKKPVTAFEIKKALAEKHYRDFFITECKSGPTQTVPAGTLKILDGLAIKKSWTAPCFTGYEIKISRSDFLRDVKFYTYTEICNCLYIVCPKGMIDRKELPESIGLMYYDPEKATITTKKKAVYRKIEYSPELLLYIIFSRLDSDRIPFFSDRREYFEAYVAGKMDNRDLARATNSRIVADNARLERELQEVGEFKRQYEIYKAIQDVIHKHGIWVFRASDAAVELDKALSKTVPDGIADIRKDMERITNKLKRMEERADKGKGEETT